MLQTTIAVKKSEQREILLGALTEISDGDPLLKYYLKALVDKMEKTVTEEGKKTVFISHGDCLKDAELVADMVRERFGTEDIHINYVGPVIGAHSGPGTLALFYLGTVR